MKQAELELPQAPVTPEVVRGKTTLTDAMKLAMSVSQRTEQAVRMDLDISASQWSRIFTARTHHFPQDLLPAFIEAVGNDIALQWLAGRHGYGLVLLEDEKDRRIRELEERLAEERSKREAVVEFMRETRA